jgi:hypothetical protein
MYNTAIINYLWRFYITNSVLGYEKVFVSVVHCRCWFYGWVVVLAAWVDVSAIRTFTTAHQ